MSVFSLCVLFFCSNIKGESEFRFVSGVQNGCFSHSFEPSLAVLPVHIGAEKKKASKRCVEWRGARSSYLHSTLRIAGSGLRTTFRRLWRWTMCRCQG